MNKRFWQVRRRTLAGSICVLLLAGCGSILSGSGPSRGTILGSSADESFKYALIEVSASNIREFRREKPFERSVGVSLPATGIVKLVKGDVIRVLISDSNVEGALFASLANGGTVFEDVRLDADGSVSLPYLGSMRAEGKTVDQLSSDIRKSLLRVAADPQVRVSLTRESTGSILVAGAVKSPGRVSALQAPLTLLDAINFAGGPTLEPHLVQVVVRDGTRVVEYDYDRLLAEGNVPVRAGSEVILERSRKRFVAMGAVKNPGLHDLPSARSSLLDVLGTVGGLDDRSADPTGVFVFRQDSADDNLSDGAQVFMLNLKKVESIFLARQFQVLPEDAVYVTNAAVYEWQKIISPIVQALVLGRTVGSF